MSHAVFDGTARAHAHWTRYGANRVLLCAVCQDALLTSAAANGLLHVETCPTCGTRYTMNLLARDRTFRQQPPTPPLPLTPTTTTAGA